MWRVLHPSCCLWLLEALQPPKTPWASPPVAPTWSMRPCLRPRHPTSPTGPFSIRFGTTVRPWPPPIPWRAIPSPVWCTSSTRSPIGMEEHQRRPNPVRNPRLERRLPKVAGSNGDGSGSTCLWNLSWPNARQKALHGIAGSIFPFLVCETRHRRHQCLARGRSIRSQIPDHWL